MCEAPGSVVTLLCSGIQLYSAERRIADCILADVKRASMCTSAELARLSCSSEATITRLCHKLGFENYRKFQLALARDAMEQQEAQRMRDEGQDELHQALLNILANREEELRATIQAIDTRQLRQILSLLRSCEVMEVVSEGGGLPVAFDASIRFSHLGKRCVSSAVHEKNLAFAQTLTPKDILIVLSASGQSARLEEVSAVAKGRDVPVLVITCDSHGPLAQLADYVMTASNREQRLIEGSHAASLLSPNVLIEVLYYLLRMEICKNKRWHVRASVCFYHWSSRSLGRMTSSSAAGSATRRRLWLKMAFSSVLRARRPLPAVRASSAWRRS